jgi:hypothetical protein
MESLQNLLPVQPGQVIEASGLELCSISERPFTAEENAVLQENGGAFLQTNYRLKGAMIVVAPRVCPILSLMGVWHESAHFIRGDSGLGYARDERMLENDELESRTQELAEMGRRRRTGALLDHCSEGCFLARVQPTECTHPDLGEVLDGLTQLSTGGQELRRVLIERARTPEGRIWFAEAGRGTFLHPKPKKRQPPADELDPASVGARVAAAVGAVVAAALEGETLVEGEHIRDEGSGRVLRSVSRVSGRISEDESEDTTVLMERFVDPLTDEPVPGELGRWHEPEPEAEA